MPVRFKARAWLGPLFFWAACLFSAGCGPRSALPPAMSDREFWSLSEALSEPPGAFTISENFVSNEPHFAENIRFLAAAHGAYIGVGPEQNFSYIAALRPSMAFIVDIRRENRNLHLLYKALFDLSSDRVEFVSLLFSRPRPPGLRSSAGIDEIFKRYDTVAPVAGGFSRNLAQVRERLLAAHGLPLSASDLEWIERAYKAFYADGPAIQFWGSRTGSRVRPSYRALMTMVDFTGRSRSYLASEDAFRFVKDLHARNLIVPVVGDFAGPTAIPRVGQYVREHADVVRAFYGSNVAVYLTNAQTRAFCRNLAALPAASDARFIESDSVRSFESKLTACQVPSSAR